MARKQRRSKRIRERVPATVTVAGEDLSVTGFTRDISKEGLFILTRHPFAPGRKVKIELAYKDRTAHLSGVVIHAAHVPHHLRAVQSSGMGIEIARPPSAPREAGAAERGALVGTDTEAVVFFGSERHLLQLHNLSTSGAALISDFDLPEVPFIRMHVKLTASEVIEIDGVPVRSERLEKGSLTAVRFLEPPDEVVERIETFVNERNEDDW
jgi:hypothetical protein